jgi:multicomponent Na+:H+ antiporter subunit F
MTDFLLLAACFVMAMVALGLIGIVRRSAGADLILAVQLIGSGGTAILVLLAVATGTQPIVDVALMLALLAAFAAVAFVARMPDASGGKAPVADDNHP